MTQFEENNPEQLKEFILYLKKYFDDNNLFEQVKIKNIYNSRYNINNDLFIHIRLTDASCWNPGLEYYLKAILHINVDKLYISSDDINHIIINSKLTS